MVLQYLVGRERHAAVVVALHLVERHVLVTREFQHTPEVGLLLVASEEFQLTVARDDDDRRCIRTDVDERRILIDSGLQGADALLLAYVVMRDALTAEGHERGQRVGIDAILCEPVLVEPYHVEQVAASRVSGHKIMSFFMLLLRLGEEIIWGKGGNILKLLQML